MGSEVVIKISGDTKDLDKEFEKVNKSVDKMGSGVAKTMGNTSATIGKQFQSINNDINKMAIASGAVFAGVTLAVKGFISDFIEADEITQQLENSFKNLGPAAGISIKDIDKLAGEVQSYSKFSDTAVKKSASLLLTFQNLSGKTVLRATEAVTDMAAALGKDLTSAAQMVGKALEDPAEGLSRLGIAGIKFSGEQERVIKNLVETGNVAEAQNIVLAELEKRFNGAAEATGKGAGAWAILKNTIGELSEEIGKNLSEQLESIVKWLQGLVTWVKENDGAIKIFSTGLIALGKAALVFLTIAAGAKAFLSLNSAIGTVTNVIPKVASLIMSMSASMGVAKTATEAASLAVKGLVGATGLGLLVVFLPDIINLLKDFWKWVEGPKIDPKNFDQVADQLNSTSEKLRLMQEKLKKARENGYSEIDTKPLRDQIAKLEAEQKKLTEIKNKLMEAHKAGQKVEGLKQKKTPEERAKIIKDKKAKESGKTETQLKDEERMKILAQEKQALLLQRDFEVKTRKSTTETLKALDQEAAFTKGLTQTKETEETLKNIETQKAAFEKSLEDRKAIELKYIQEKGKLDQEAVKARETGGTESEALLANIEIKKQILDEAHKADLAKNAQQEGEKRDQAATFLQERMAIDEENRIAKEELDAEQHILEMELDRTLKDEELAALKAHLDAKRNLEKEANAQYLNDVLKYGKGIADAKKIFQSQDVKNTEGFLDNINTLTKGKSKELGLINKAFRIKDVIIDTAAAIAKANTVPPPGNIPAIAFAATTGAVQLATIASTGFAKGGIVTGGIPGVDSVPALLKRGEVVQPERNFDKLLDDKLAARTNNQPPSISVIVQGNIMADDDSQVDKLVQRISDSLEFRNLRLYGVT